MSRERLLAARAAAGLTQMLALTVIPAVVIVLVSPVVSKSFPLIDALTYAIGAFAGCAVMFSLAFFLSSMFENVWAPVVLTLCAGAALAALERITGADRFSLLRMIHGESYFHGLGLPWTMLLVSAVASMALIYAGIRHVARQDF